jgi:hypothetical protein
MRWISRVRRRESRSIRGYRKPRSALVKIRCCKWYTVIETAIFRQCGFAATALKEHHNLGN